MTEAPAASARIGPLAGRVGRGVAVSASFTIGLQALGLIQSVLVPRLLGPENLGLFAVAMAGVGIASQLKDFGLDDKLAQDEHTDLPIAFSVAFTIEAALSTLALLGLLVAAPVMAAVLDRPELALVVAVLASTVYTNAFLRLSGALFLRRLHYGRRNLVGSVGPVVNFAVTVPLAFAGAGVWALVGGAVAAFVASVGVVVWTAPLRPRLRLDRGVVRSYLQFGWPLWVNNILGMSTTLAGSIVITHWIGFAGVGFFSLAQGLIQRAFVVDLLMTQALFPALARTQSDLDGHRRAFLAISRVTVIWSSAVGFGLALFGGDLVTFVLGPAWAPAVFLFRMAGLSVAIGSLGFAWDVFYKARGETRPLMVFGAISEAWVLVVLLPAAALWGVDGAAWALLLLGVMVVPIRQRFIRRLFEGVTLVRSAWRELTATGAAALMTILLREVWAPRSFAAFTAQAALYLVGVGVAVIALDGAFLREILWRARQRTPTTAAHESGNQATEPGLRAADTPAAIPPAFELDVPGSYPLGLAVDGDRVWVTCRDSSTLAWTDLPDGRWRTLRLPAYPHLPAVNQGVAWVGLTLSGRVAAVDPSGQVAMSRLARTHEILVTAADGGGCAVVENGRQHKRLWSVPAPGAPATCRDLPGGMVRPDFVITSSTHADDVWITDTASPFVARLAGEATLVAVPGGTRFGVRDEARRILWLGHTALSAVSAVGLDAPFPVLAHVAVPSIPFGMTLDPSGRLWVACPQVSRVVAVTIDGATDAQIAVEPGSWPIGVAWWRAHLLTLCAKSGRLVAHPFNEADPAKATKSAEQQGK